MREGGRIGLHVKHWLQDALVRLFPALSRIVELGAAEDPLVSSFVMDKAMVHTVNVLYKVVSARWETGEIHS